MSELELVDEEQREQLGSKTQSILSWLGVLVLVYLLITAVSLISLGFKSIAGEQAKELFAFATNPFAALIVGTLATALIQSSSTVTSIIVGLVAGGLPITVAVPMIMGSNIGTTITNTLVSLGHIHSKEEFKKAFAAATIHDFFNLVSVIIFLPLEITTHFLEKTALLLSDFFIGGEAINLDKFNFVQIITLPLVSFIERLTRIFPKPFDGIGLIVIGIILIFIAIFYIGKLLKLLMVGQAKVMLRMAMGRGPITGIFAGTLVTILVQSSSTTTSLIVPLAGTGLLTLEQVYPFTLGANIGTCITALLAATAVTTNQIAALEIALVHLLYNVIGVIIIYGIPWLRNLPILGATTLANLSSERKYLAFIYIIFVFFLIPGLLLGITYR
ncbi:Na/Pi symporter [Crocosphaera sp. XPORK-15E]|uniref:Na/Pi symporter n=1 Tax=Crocosphaera sp. XPORK-15E TaxID=3110247 RepID=UPI002B2012D1|nr:Na/Pi symporter [Crocosphaera sp. XPORK-15E]MEA5535889.1 Na/Pi symporter [Crocosphaera sp. XPORK-15E]